METHTKLNCLATVILKAKYILLYYNFYAHLERRQITVMYETVDNVVSWRIEEGNERVSQT